VRSFTDPSRVIASEDSLLRSIWGLLPDRPISEPQLYQKLRAVPRLTTDSLEGLVARLVSAGALNRLPENNFQRAVLPPEPDGRAVVETRCSAGSPSTLA
jgi:hypothetical protein